MESIDKNDVNIEKLFGWKGSFDLKDEDGQIITKVYMRLLGDSDINRTRVYALRESANFRKLLKNKESDEFIALLSSAEFFSLEQLIDTIAAVKIREFAQEAVNELIMVVPNEPSDGASLEELERYQEEIDNYPKERAKQLKDMIDQKIENFKKTLQNKSFNELLEKEYYPLATNTLCETKMIDAFKDMCVFLGTYKNSECTIRFFKNVEEFNNLQSNIKSQLKDFYLSLEIGTEELKKLPEATQ